MGNDDVLQILKAINDLREEVRENKKEIETLKSDVKEIKSDMKQDKKHIEDILWSFQTSVENMFNENKREIRELQKIVDI